ncbi:MAG: HD domain-containing protein [Puniceicoccaceae bacterium]|nr:MAG: HD domain-containing protein [Puniceicoccaceae bacterium]
MSGASGRSPFPLPPALRKPLEALRKAGGRPLLVGGGVRDWLSGLPAADLDAEVFGLPPDRVESVLAKFGRVDLVGRSFAVFKLRLGGEIHDFSLPRRERKTGRGHQAFVIDADPFLSPEEAAARRDFSVNAISLDALTGEILDPCGGLDDLRQGILRHTSPAFAEDPLRVLRGFQFAGRFAWRLHPETAALCRELWAEFYTLPRERIWGEWQKWAGQSTRPSAGLQVLQTSGWLGFFPEIAGLRGVPQDPEWHPEGDVWIHTGKVVDALATDPTWQERPVQDRAIELLAALTHDLGKACTTRKELRGETMRWVSPGHDEAGLPIARRFLARIGAPKSIVEKVLPLVRRHMVGHSWRGQAPSASAVRRLARNLAPATIESLARLLRADAAGRGGLPSSGAADRLLKAASDLALADQAPRPILLGRHLVEAGLTPGPEFGPILEAAASAQEEGAFDTEDGARAWLQAYLKTNLP